MSIPQAIKTLRNALAHAESVYRLNVVKDGEPSSTLQNMQSVLAATAHLDTLLTLDRPTFQQRVQPWMMECFGPEIAGDAPERNHRFFEEAAELMQACGMPQAEAHMLVNYVYARPLGEKEQEVGGVMVTLAALCLAQEIDMHHAAEVELARIWTKVEAIRAKQATKPKNSPLPTSPAGASWTPASNPPDADTTVMLALADGEVWQGYFDGAGWIEVSGLRLAPGRVTYWQHTPAHPDEKGGA